MQRKGKESIIVSRSISVSSPINHWMVCRMAVALWSSRTPGAAQLDRDRQMMNNKKKVSFAN